MKKIILYFVIFFCSLDTICAQTNLLDPSFGYQGIVRTNIGSSFDYNSTGKQVLTASDGSIYILFNNPTFISKRLSNGSLDSSYGVNGFSNSVPFNNAFAALQADGKMVIVGSEFTIERMKANGTPDSTFGINSIQNAFNASSFATAVVIQADGKIVVGGTFVTNKENTPNGEYYFAVARFNANGNPDDTFNDSGKVITDFGFKIPPDPNQGETDSVAIHNQAVNTLLIQPDGKIVAAGYAAKGLDIDFALTRYNSNGQPDSLFNNIGRQTTNFGVNDIGNSLAIESDGKIILAGYLSNGINNNVGVARYKTNGIPDSTFNGNGKKAVGLNLATQTGLAAAVQNDDKIVVVSSTLDGPANNDFEIIRFNTNGSLDNTFDGDGILTTDFASSDDYGVSVSIQKNDNKIVAAGYSYIISQNHVVQEIALARYNSNGSLDDSFGSNGKLEGNPSQGYTTFSAHAIQNDGKVIAVGQAWNGVDYDFAIARYNNDGRPDSSFSGDGLQITNFGGTDGAVGVLVQPNGKIVVAGNNDSKFAIARYNADGTLDNTFNGSGMLTDSVGMVDVCHSVALQNDGKIVAAGYSFTDPFFDSAYFSLVRFNIDGTPDNTFNGNGKQFTDFGSHSSFGNALAIQADGKILVAGESYINNQDNFSLSRYNIDGSLDTTFSHDGKQNNVFGADNYFIESMAIQNNGKIIVAGYSQTSQGDIKSALAVARYATNGVLDTTFNKDGFRSTTVGAHFNFAKAVAVNNDGIVAVGGSNDNFTIALYKANGNLDSAFGSNGIVITDLSVGTSTIQSLSFRDDKLYAAGDGQFPGEMGIVARYILPQGGSLPVSLLDFTGTLRDKSVLLQWKVATEKDLAKYVIERSSDGVRFLPINSVASTGTGGFTREYSAVDDQPFQGINFYRLKMVGTDGKFTYSNIVAVKINTGNKLLIFPNPVERILFVEASGNDENALVQIVDAGGRKMKEMKISLTGQAFFSIDISGLPGGFYNLLLHKNGKTEVRTFIKK